ncbi:MAG: 50S ribosomal protein L25 [Candidatus Gracilibacteria bacterium]
MSPLTLVATARDPKADLRIVRGTANRGGSVPGVVYGKKVPSTPILLDTSDLLRVFRVSGFSHIIDLTLDGKKHQVIIHDVQVHPVSGDFQHVDFYAVVASDKLHVTVPVKLVGTSQAARDGAIIEHVMQDIEVRCLPADIPAEIEVDISVLEKAGDMIHISDLTIDRKKIEILHHEETEAIVIASAFQEYVEEVVVAPADVEVLTEKKEGEEGEAPVEETKAE